MTLLDSFLDTDVIALDDVAYFLRHEEEGFDEGASLAALVDLGTRLPSGLVYAEAVWILPEPPAGVEPLAPSSPWYAIDRSLAVVLPPVRRAITAVLADLARYHAIALRVRRELEPRPDLIEALGSDVLSPGAATELAVLLDAPPALAASLDEVSSGLRADLAAMATERFQPVVRLHAALRTRTLVRRGAKLAEVILSRVPDGPFRVILSDGNRVVEHLSPYVRDLGHALVTWGLENEDRLSVPELSDALRRSRAKPSTDLAALVIPDLVACAPELLEERRRAELSAGLDLRDEPGAVHGWAELSRLALPDEHAIPADASGTLVVLAAEAEDLLVEALRGLLETGRVIGVAGVFGAPLDVDRPVIADAITSDDDALRFTSANDLSDRAAKLGIEILRSGCLGIGGEDHVPGVVLDAFALVRRAKVLGRVPEDAAAFGLLYPRGDGVRQRTLDTSLSELLAGRLALGVLSSSREDTTREGRARRSMSQNAPGISRRFRA